MDPFSASMTGLLRDGTLPSASVTFDHLQPLVGNFPTGPASALGNIQPWSLQTVPTWGPVPATRTLAPTGRAGRTGFGVPKP